MLSKGICFHLIWLLKEKKTELLCESLSVDISDVGVSYQFDSLYLERAKADDVNVTLFCAACLQETAQRVGAGVHRETAAIQYVHVFGSGALCSFGHASAFN